MKIYNLLLKLISNKDKSFDIIIGDEVLRIKDSGLLLKFCIKIGNKYIPSKEFIGMPFVILSWFLGTLIKIKDNIPLEIYIHESEYVLVFIKNENKITVFSWQKYKIINYDSTNLIKSETRVWHTIKKKVYEDNYVLLVKKLYSIGIELKEKFCNKEKLTGGEYDFEISLNKFQKYLSKLEKRNI